MALLNIVIELTMSWERTSYELEKFNDIYFNYHMMHTEWRNSFFLEGATKSYFTHYSFVVFILFNTGVCKSAFSTNSFRKQVFIVLRFLSFLSAMCWIRCNLHKLYSIICVFVLTYEKQFLNVIKIWVQFLIKNMPPESSWTFKF